MGVVQVTGWSKKTWFIVSFCVILLHSTHYTTGNDGWKKKDVRDYTDADIERLYEQWEEDEEELEEDELPEHLRPQPKIDLSELDPNNPESMLQQTKKGRTLMMFATVSGDPTEKETEEITQIWHSGLFNANYELQRYVVGSNRVLFMLKDGAKAWHVKNFLTQQERCESVTIEGKDYLGKGSPNYDGTKEEETDTESTEKKKKSTQEKKKKATEEDKKKKKKDLNSTTKKKEEL